MILPFSLETTLSHQITICSYSFNSSSVRMTVGWIRKHTSKKKKTFFFSSTTVLADSACLSLACFPIMVNYLRGSPPSPYKMSSDLFILNIQSLWDNICAISIGRSLALSISFSACTLRSNIWSGFKKTSASGCLDPDPQILREDRPLFMEWDEDRTFKARSAFIHGD